MNSVNEMDYFYESYKIENETSSMFQHHNEMNEKYKNRKYELIFQTMHQYSVIFTYKIYK